MTLALRQTGRTTRQMLDAPHGALFVWCAENTSYPTHLASSIGRDDLQIVRPSWVRDQKWRGLRLKALVVDHAALVLQRNDRAFKWSLLFLEDRMREMSMVEGKQVMKSKPCTCGQGYDIDCPAEWHHDIPTTERAQRTYPSYDPVDDAQMSEIK